MGGYWHRKRRRQKTNEDRPAQSSHNSGLFSLQRMLLPDVNLDRVTVLKYHAVYGKEIATFPVWVTKGKKSVPISILLIRKNAKEDLKLPFCTAENFRNLKLSSYMSRAPCTKVKLRDPVLFCDHSIISYDWGISKVWVWTVTSPTQRVVSNKCNSLCKTLSTIPSKHECSVCWFALGMLINVQNNSDFLKFDVFHKWIGLCSFPFLNKPNLNSDMPEFSLACEVH